MHPIVIDTNAHGEDESDNNGHSNHEAKDFSDSDVDVVSDDIDDEGTNYGNVYTLSVENLGHGIVIRNDFRAHILIVDPATTHASKFPKYQDIITSHLILADPESDELFVCNTPNLTE